MSSIIRIDLTIPSSTATFTAKTLPKNTDARMSFERLGAYLHAIAGAVYSGKINETTGAVRATSTFTFASTGPTNNETCTVANVTFTAKTSGATGNQFNISSTDTVVAANFAAAINGSTSLVGIVSATVSGAVVTLTSLAPGNVGNGIETGVGTLANTTVVAFAGGAESARYAYSVGQ